MSEPTTYNNVFDNQGHLTDSGIQAFVAGKLSESAKVHAEEHIANCDMCADAVEGAAMLYSTNSLQESLQHVSDRIDEHVKPKRRIVPLWNRYMAAAAIVLVLFGLVLVTNQYVLNNGNDGLAEKASKTADKEENVTPETEEVYDTESSDELPVYESDQTSERPTINNDAIIDVADKDTKAIDKPEALPVTNERSSSPTPTSTQKKEQEFEVETNTFEWQEEKVVANGNASNDAVLNEVTDELADIEDVSTSKQRNNVDKEIQQEEGVKLESTSAAPSNVGYAPDSYTGGNTDTTLTEYLSNFSLSDSLAQSSITGNVIAEIELNRKGLIKRVTILQGLSPAIDKEVESYIMLTPLSATMQYLHNGGTLPIKATVSIP